MFDDRIRTSDADREKVTSSLRDHFAEGRLTHEELDERITAALSAKTFGELRRVMADLPGPKLATYQPKRPAGGAGYRPPVMFRRRPRVFPLLVLALLAVVLFSGAGAGVLALKVVAIISMVMLLAFAAVAIAGAMFFRRVRKQWQQAQFFDGDSLGAWAERLGSGQFKFQSWEWPPRPGHHHHHHHRGSRDSGYDAGENNW